MAGGGWLTLTERGVVGGTPGGSVGASPTADGDQPASEVDQAAGLPEATPAARRPGSPRRVVIPALGVDAPVVPVAAPGRVLVPPSDPTQLGWWAGGAAPGAARGSALVAGHTVGAGGGALDDLEALERGDRVVVRTSRGGRSFQVRTVRIYEKAIVAERAEDLFDQDVAGRLLLLTCEDWDGERYRSNVVVTAAPAR